MFESGPFLHFGKRHQTSAVLRSWSSNDTNRRYRHTRVIRSFDGSSSEDGIYEELDQKVYEKNFQSLEEPEFFRPNQKRNTCFSFLSEVC